MATSLVPSPPPPPPHCGGHRFADKLMVDDRIGSITIFDLRADRDGYLSRSVSPPISRRLPATVQSNRSEKFIDADLLRPIPRAGRHVCTRRGAGRDGEGGSSDLFVPHTRTDSMNFVDRNTILSPRNLVECASRCASRTPIFTDISLVFVCARLNSLLLTMIRMVKKRRD